LGLTTAELLLYSLQAVRDVISDVLGVTPPTKLPEPETQALGTVDFTSWVPLLSHLDRLNAFPEPSRTSMPSHMEAYGTATGMIVYRCDYLVCKPVDQCC
jgi:hypothetical protein